MNNTIFCKSEVDELRQVIVHRPDDGLEMITPSNSEALLYDDIVYLKVMQEEHEIFQTILQGFVGKENVKDTQELLYEVLVKDDGTIRNKFLDYLYELEDVEESDIVLLKALDAKDFVYTMFTGILEKEDRVLFPPLPNYVFTRDIGVVIKDHLLIANPSKEARKREAILTRCICYYHPMFASCQENNDEKIIDMTHEGDDYTIEGGDVMVFNDNYLLVGNSERTTDLAFKKLKDKLLEKKVIENIVEITIPKQRTCMHIDTLFTQISKDEFVIYEATLRSPTIKVEMHSVDGKITEFDTLEAFFLSVNPNMKFILCGDGEAPYDEREQWTDGCNLVALNDGIAIAYDRNTKTSETLEKAGYKLVDGVELCEDIESGKFDKSNYKKAIILIPSTELSRARGGPHCMSFPVSRG